MDDYDRNQFFSHLGFIEISGETRGMEAACLFDGTIPCFESAWLYLWYPRDKRSVLYETGTGRLWEGDQHPIGFLKRAAFDGARIVDLNRELQQSVKRSRRNN